MANQARRTGAIALGLLASPLNVHILEALKGGQLAPLELRRAANSPPASTMRVYLRNLLQNGVVEQRRQDAFPPEVKYGLTPAGHALLSVGLQLQAWLNASPEGPMPLGSPASKSATRALVEGWSTNIVRALAARPYSLTELSRLNIQTSYPALERRLSAMRLVNQVEPSPGGGRGTPYRATDWLRRAVAPLASATAWERRHLPDSAPRIGRLDVEAAFLLAAPLLELPSTLTAKVRLAVEVGRATTGHAGVRVEIEEGKVASCSSRLEGDADASISGTAMGWLRQMNGASGFEVEFGGDRKIGEEVLQALRTSVRPAGTDAVAG